MLTKISVVIPTYKRPDLLKRCLDALLNQSIDQSEYEVIVVSDGYDQQTMQLVLSYKLYTFKYLFLPRKKGPAAARNLGWQSAAANIIAFTDDDTVPDNQWLEGFLNSYHHEMAEAFTGKVTVPVPEEPTDYELNIAHLETADFVTANCACTRTALEMVAGFDEQYSMAWREDSDLEFRLLKANIPIYHLQEALVVHPVRKASWGVSIREQRKGIYNALLYKKFPDLYRKKIQRTPQWDYYLMIVALIVALYGNSMNSNPMLIAGLAVWSILELSFIIRRLRNTSRSFSHVMEMIVTSLIIPFLSVYWHLYGALRYRVLFL